MDRKTFFNTVKAKGLYFNLGQCARSLCQGQDVDDAIWNRFEGCTEETIIDIAMEWRLQLERYCYARSN